MWMTRGFVVLKPKFAYRPKDKSSKAKEGAKNRASTSNEASTSKGDSVPKVNTQMADNNERVNEDMESDVDKVYDEFVVLMASGIGGAMEHKAFCKASDINLHGQIRLYFMFGVIISQMFSSV
ncbi:hypothetical protein Tco_1446835 [Tanacetum coccineum]